MESLDFENFKISIKSTNVPQHDRLEPAAGGERCPIRSTWGSPRPGPSGRARSSPRSAWARSWADGVGDTIRISLSTFHAEEEVKVAWEILKALHLRERGPGG